MPFFLPLHVETKTQTTLIRQLMYVFEFHVILKGGTSSVRDITIEISDMLASYSISSKPTQLSFEIK